MKQFYSYEQVVWILQKFMETITGEGETEAREFVNAFPLCDISGCTDFSEWEGWIGEGFIRKVNVCNAHKHLLRGYKGE